jgi:hypothetical protein
VVSTLFTEPSEIDGFSLTVTTADCNEAQPVVLFVNTNVAVPFDNPVITPLLFTDATAVLLLTQVPPIVGDRVVVVPSHNAETPVILAIGKAFIVTAAVGKEAQPVVVLLKKNVAVPLDMPVTTPALLTVATNVLLLLHVPPVVGDKVVVPPTHIDELPIILTVGNELIVTAGVAKDVQPVAVLVNVNVAVPLATPVTTPVLLTVAVAVLLLTQVPPVIGDKFVALPTQIEFKPVILAVGILFTVAFTAIFSVLAPVLVKVIFPLDVPVALAAILTKILVAFTTPLTCVSVMVLVYVPVLVVLTSIPVGATITILFCKLVPLILKLCEALALPVQLLKLVSVPEVEIVASATCTVKLLLLLTQPVVVFVTLKIKL